MQKTSYSLVSFDILVATCGRPDVPESKFTATSYMDGGEVTFTGCNEGYKLQGDDKYTCNNGHWEPDLNARCKSMFSQKVQNSWYRNIPFKYLVLVSVILCFSTSVIVFICDCKSFMIH